MAVFFWGVRLAFSYNVCASPKPRSGLGDWGCGVFGDALLCVCGSFVIS